MKGIDRRAGGRPRALAALLLGLAIGLAAGHGPLARAAEPSAAFRIITHPDNAAGSVERAFLADAFLKKRTRWPSGESIVAVDLRVDAPARKHFSEKVLRRSVFAVRSYWQQRIFTGRGVPPPELDTDEAVIEHVQRHPGAVGYVSGRAAVETVKVLAVR